MARSKQINIVIRAKDAASKTLKKFTKGLAGITKIAKGVGIAVAALTAAFAVMAKSVIDAGDKFDKMSQRFGVSVENLSSLSLALELSGTVLETFAKGIKTLSKNSLDFANGIGEAKREFEDLQIAVKNSDGTMKDSLDIMLQVADRFALMEDGTKKTAQASIIFGRAGVELIPLLNQGSEAIQRQIDLANELGITMDTKTAKSMAKFNDTLTIAKAALAGASRQIITDLMPSLQMLAQVFLGVLQTVGDNSIIIANFLKKMAKNSLRIFVNVMESYGVVLDVFQISLAAMAASWFKTVDDFFFLPLRLAAQALAGTGLLPGVAEKMADVGGAFKKTTGDIANHALALTIAAARQKRFGDVLDEFAEKAKSFDIDLLLAAITPGGGDDVTDPAGAALDKERDKATALLEQRRLAGLTELARLAEQKTAELELLDKFNLDKTESLRFFAEQESEIKRKAAEETVTMFDRMTEATTDFATIAATLAGQEKKTLLGRVATTAQTIGKIMKIIGQGKIKENIIGGVTEGALALASLGAGDIRGAALHGAASVAHFAAIAQIATLIGGAIGGGGGSGSRGGGGGGGPASFAREEETTQLPSRDITIRVEGENFSRDQLIEFGQELIGLTDEGSMNTNLRLA